MLEGKKMDCQRQNAKGTDSAIRCKVWIGWQLTEHDIASIG